MNTGFRLVALGLLWPGVALAQSGAKEGPGRSIALVKMPYRGERNLPDLSDVPDYLEKGGIQKLLEGQGSRLKPISTVVLSPEDQKAYGEWNRLGLANGTLARIVAADRKEGYFPVGHDRPAHLRQPDARRDSH